MSAEIIDTRKQVVRVKVRRGMLTIGPGRKILGLWEFVRRETITNAQTRRLCGNITRQTLIRWRGKDFPEPVLRIKAKGGLVELWSKTEVEGWLTQRKEPDEP